VQTRTNIVLDDKLVESAMRKAGVRTKREAVEAALHAFVREADYAALLALRGAGGVAEGHDPKAYGAAQIDAP
jgi:Arc/MetJ family transcription regulator